MATLKLLLVLLWLGVTTSSKVDLQKRIIGGKPCEPNERLYHVLLVINQRFCGGSLIRNGWILTAAHCWENGRAIDAYLGWNLGNGVPTKITKTPKTYKDGSLFKKRTHDLMLLKLPDTAAIPNGVRPIELPDCQNQPDLDNAMQIAGLASTSGSFFTSRQPGYTPDLQCVNINKVSCTRLREQQLSENSWYSYQHWFCGQTPGVDACFGDSGGGVEYRGRLYGIITFTGDPVHPCRKPMGFMDLCHQDYRSWIEKTTGLIYDQVYNQGYNV
ncbi:hypothetical protein CHARACLAT_009669 [Characodon lateralis]|uniref:Peptidase S1 domain-containing protein n=1 Tax=Characodon lateralis TaxID=208331 RepID=A0ABU7DF41_9TELE|nr:hypothetical protein [Characodon lateralis]